MNTPDEIPPDLQAAIEAERTGEGPLNRHEVFELAALEISMEMRGGRLGMLCTARLEWLRERFSKHGRMV